MCCLALDYNLQAYTESNRRQAMKQIYTQPANMIYYVLCMNLYGFIQLTLLGLKTISVLPEIMRACLKVAWLNIFIDCQAFTIILTYIAYVTLTSLKPPF